MDPNENKDVKLSVEVEPFIPQIKGADGGVLVPMSWPREAGLGGGGTGLEATPIPSYLITCYPFVQENQPHSRQLPIYSGDLRWQQPNPSPGGPYLAYPILSSAQAPVTNDYAYYQFMPATCSPMMGFYQPFPAPFTAPVQTTLVSSVSSDCGDRTPPSAQDYSIAGQRGRGLIRTAVLPKQLSQLMRTKRQHIRKESSSSGPDGRKMVLLVDAAQQTDLNVEATGTPPLETMSPLVWKGRARRRRTPQLAVAESSSEHGASEADIDSDSGYCSPKHHQVVGAGLRPHDPNDTAGAEVGIMTALSWVNVASQKPWVDRNAAFQRAGNAPERRNYPQLDLQVGYRGYGGSSGTLSKRGCGLQNRLQEGAVQATPPHPTTVIQTEPLYFEDEDEFPELVPEGSRGSPVLSKPEEVQPKLAKSLLENLPESSPISIVQTPIPITTSIPKRAKSQRKKALAAALATAQEYSEISMEQRKIQEALRKAAGKKSKTPVQLDLGDMLAALEKQQQAMKARQLTKAKPLSYTVGTTGLFNSKDSDSKAMTLKSQRYTVPHNMLDSTAPRVKRGKEREVPKVKRPTTLKKIILKEREGKISRFSLDQSPTGLEEQRDEELHSQTSFLVMCLFALTENRLSMPSDVSLSPASQNSLYSITPISQGSPASSGIGSPMATSAITKIHSRRFREYCNQVLNKDIDESVTLLLQELVCFQERVYQKDPTKAKAKRRLVMGLREVTKHMRLHKIKCVIISPNCEKIQAKGGLDEALYNVITMAREQEIPFVFALGRKALGRCVNKLVPVSVVGIFNFSGAEGLFSRLVSLTEEARKAYRDMVSALEQEQAEEALKNIKKVPHHMGHSRNPSAASAISFCSVISEPISEVNEREHETNWRNMVEMPDDVEAEESERETCGLGSTPTAPLSTREEGRPDDRLEQASQQSTETGSLDGNSRDPRIPSVTSTASTLVPGMLEEEEEEEEEEPVSAQAPSFSSRIESWVFETLENLQLGAGHNSSEEEEEEEEGERGCIDEEELDSTELTEPGFDMVDQLELKNASC
ncbi:selenocysteine insertion sequence-binding protein 2-like [Megalops cyprinoides]|uniref:selenocysteine insertion sequence-binding protein 2-like n=1 Tax=Megalops cyprinoides TaxID=118141 RepID=UPI001863E9B6|nr:selenocysteine insertion sequence-binding protein 2-like [Megalops cyprinoides]